MNAERFLPPKELSGVLLRDHGLPLSADYIRAIRRETIRRGDGVFLLGMARASDLLAWARKNPQFRRRGVKKRPGIA